MPRAFAVIALLLLPTPSKNDCWKCHDQNAAVEHSFVQFYPELLKIARAKSTLKPGVRLDN